jgi:uncharacterized damage-inducible protein DinB
MSTASFKDLLFHDLPRELLITRRVLEALPADKFNWQPHEKSMSLMGLGIHVATLPEWIHQSLAADVLDFKNAPRPPREVASTAELVALFDKHVAELNRTVANFDIEKFNDTWSMKNGDQVFTAQPRIKVYRTWSLNHLVHHRGQLALYLRLLNVKVPTIYFNTADDPAFVFE